MRRLLPPLPLLAALTASVAAAATLAVSSERLTVVSQATSVPATTCVAAPAADTYIDELSSLLESNFGTGSSMSVRSKALENRRSLVRFDLAACSIPAGASVRSALLKLYLATAPGSSRSYPVHRITSTWSETNVTWLGQPSVASSATATTTTGTTSGVTLQWDVVADVKAFVAGTATNHGWRVMDSSEGALLGITGMFTTRESSSTSQHPRLEVTYYP